MLISSKQVNILNHPKQPNYQIFYLLLRHPLRFLCSPESSNGYETSFELELELEDDEEDEDDELELSAASILFHHVRCGNARIFFEFS